MCMTTGLTRFPENLKQGFYNYTDLHIMQNAGAVLPLHRLSQKGFVANIALNVRECHLNSPCRSKTQSYTPSWLWHAVLGHTQMCAYGICAPHSFAGCEMPCGWTAICSFVYFIEERRWAHGEGRVLVCPPLSPGHRWPRYVCGSGKARGLLSCHSAKMDEIREVQWRAGVDPKASASETVPAAVA